MLGPHIVFVYVAQGMLPLNHYVRSSLVVAKANNPNSTVTFITGCTVQHPPKGIQLVNSTELYTPEMADFRSLYLQHIQPEWVENGQVEWSVGHLLRYMYLKEYMFRFGVTRAYYMECDVLIVRKLRQDFECDNYLWAPHTGNSFLTGRWSAWAGTSMLKLEVVMDFIAFSKKLLSTNSPLLRQKGVENPHLTDMTFWYLFLAVSSKQFRTNWQVQDTPMKSLPAANKHQICHIADLGAFDERDGDLQAGFDGWLVPGYTTKGPLYTVHFCAARKSVLHSLVTTGKYPECATSGIAWEWVVGGLLLVLCIGYFGRSRTAAKRCLGVIFVVLIATLVWVWFLWKPSARDYS